MSEDDKGQSRWNLDRYKISAEQPVPPDPFADRVLTPEEEAISAELYIAKKIRARYANDGALFWLALQTAILSVLTLGLYRFWMVTRLRRYYAQSIKVDGDPLEYTGTGIEKLLGFLVAIIVLALYLGIVNVALTFVGLSYFEGHPLALQLSLLAVLPFWFWAAYRARRYILSRLRWRGIRFGVEPGAWGYMGRSLLLSALTAATAGLAWPYQHFKQAQYMTDRTWFGDLPFRQEGSWVGLLSLWIWLYISAGIMGLLTWGMLVEMKLGPEGVTILVTTMGSIWAVMALVIFFIYQVGSFRYLWNNRRIGDAELGNDVSSMSVFVTYLGGSVLVSMATGIVAAVMFGIGAVAWTALGGPQLGALLEGGSDTPTLSQFRALGPLVGVAILGYLLVFAFSYAFTQTFITQPILRRKVEGMLVANPAFLRSAGQRRHDEASEAGGFADALGVEVGAGI